VIELVRRCGVVADDQLAGFAEQLGPDGPARLTPEGVMGLMVEQGLLTAYQAGELAADRGAGLRLGEYRVRDRLGRGGMGQVFLAEHARLGGRVAVKVLSADLRGDPAARDRFVREARAAAAVDHPNVVRVRDADVAHDPPFLVMEYVDGVSLQAAVARHGAFEPAEAAAVGVQVARGLGAADAAGLVHRDIKPANLLIDRAGRVKILDLGIARFVGEANSRQTETAVVLGTLDYLAPEQAIDSHAVDTRADLYALGATLYFLLTGYPPFPDGDLDRKMARKQSADPAPLTGLRPDVPPELAAVIHRLMARDPAERHPSPAAAEAVLAPWAVPVPPDFPARLFRPSPASGSDSGATTDFGQDSDPTRLPVTRRIVRGPQLPAAPDLPPPSPPTVPAPTPDVRSPVPAADAESGAPTDRLVYPPPEPAAGRASGLPWWVVAVGVLAAGLLAAVAGGW
jgi:serine/threonine protein kinase